METPSTLSGVMEMHKKKLMLFGRERLFIDREDIWGESVAAFKNPKFRVTAAPRVVFEGEPGIDGGGLSKEFGSLLRDKIFSTETNLFEGIEERKMPVYSVEGIHSRLFELAGKMVSYLLIHLDIGIPLLSPAIYQYMLEGSLEDAYRLCSIDDICDYELQELMRKVREVKIYCL